MAECTERIGKSPSASGERISRLDSEETNALESRVSCATKNCG